MKPKVSLIACTTALDQHPDDGINLTDIIAYCARVSNPSNQNNKATSEKLLEYLIRHKHWSPFEMVHAVLSITTTRDVSHQIVRHRSFSYQEFSQRYANPLQDLKIITDSEARFQDKKNRQSSIELTDEEKHVQFEFERMQIEQRSLAIKNYNRAIELGIAKEKARIFLPEGQTVTQLYMAGSIRSWIHYIEVRADPSTQKEHRDVALGCINELGPILPAIKTYLRKLT